MKIILFIFLVGIIISPIISSIPVSYGWEFGKFVEGDVFEYSICDEYTLDAYTALRSKCYVVTLHMIEGFEMDFGDVWLFYVEINTDDKMMRDIWIVDESFRVQPINHKYYADSIENTLFWMPTHARINNILLEIGNVVSGNSNELIKDMIVTNFSREHSSTLYTISSDSGDFIILYDDLYLPKQIDIDTDVISFNVELNSMYNELEFNAVPIDEVTVGEVIPNPTIPLHDMPLKNSAIPESGVPEIIILKSSDSTIPPESKKLPVIENRKIDTVLPIIINDSSINDTSKSPNDDNSVNPELDVPDEFDFFRWISDAFSSFLNSF